MSGQDEKTPTPQFHQSMSERSDEKRLDQQYKSIGIPAVNAVAQFMSQTRKKPTSQMS